MARRVPKNIIAGLIGSIAIAAIPLRSVVGVESTTPIPDFSGVWGRNAMDPEFLPSGPKR